VTEQQLLRMAKRRLAILRHAEEITGNVSLTCRYYGISCQVFYTWRRRYDADGLDGLRDRSHRPQVSPNATRTEVVGKIIYLRQRDHFGPAKIAMYLKRYHDIQISNSGVWRILKRLELNRLPASQRHKRHDRRWKRYEKPLPGHRVQLDVKFIAPLAGSRRKHYQFTAIDDCTRLRVLRIYPQLNQKSAIQFLDYVLERLPFRVEVIQTDNGAEFGSSFHWHVLDKGIGPMTRPARCAGPTAQKEAAAPPLTSGRAVHATGPPLWPQGCSASRCARQPCGLPLTPETTAAPGTRNSGQAQACPHHARGPQTLVAAGVDEHPGRDRPGATRHHATQQSGIGHLQIGYRQWPVGLVMIAMGSRTQWRPPCLNS
jgi:transposase